jgi:predicted ester cyclase
MSSEDNKALHRHFYEEVVNKGNPGIIDEIFTPDWVGHTPGRPDTTRDGLKAAFQNFGTSFSGSHASIEHQIADGDLVATHITMTGTNTGPMMGMPPTGKSVKYDGVEVVRVLNDKIVEFWGLLDMLTMMQQLGLAPAPPS